MLRLLFICFPCFQVTEIEKKNKKLVVVLAIIVQSSVALVSFK